MERKFIYKPNWKGPTKIEVAKETEVAFTLYKGSPLLGQTVKEKKMIGYNHFLTWEEARQCLEDEAQQMYDESMAITVKRAKHLKTIKELKNPEEVGA